MFLSFRASNKKQRYRLLIYFKKENKIELIIEESQEKYNNPLTHFKCENDD